MRCVHNVGGVSLLQEVYLSSRRCFPHAGVVSPLHEWIPPPGGVSLLQKVYLSSKRCVPHPGVASLLQEVCPCCRIKDTVHCQPTSVTGGYITENKTTAMTRHQFPQHLASSAPSVIQLTALHCIYRNTAHCIAPHCTVFTAVPVIQSTALQRTLLYIL